MISFANATGNLFNRLGSVAYLAQVLRTYQLAQYTNMVDPNLGVTAQLVSEADIQAVMGGSYLGVLSSSDASIGSVMQNLATQIVNRVVFRDNPRLGQTLTSSNTVASLQEIIRQMNVAGATVLAMTITATPGSFYKFDTGDSRDGVVVASVRRPLDGLVLENTFAENVLFTCIQDSYSGGAVAFNEPFSVTGTGSESDYFAFDWPLGSNCSTTVYAIDGNTSNGSGNLLTNSSFSTWSNNVPSNFALTEGTAGVNIYQETVIVFDSSSSSLAIVGDGAGTQTALTQQISTLTSSAGSAGTAGILQPLTQYSFNLYARRDGVVPGAGVLTVELVDQNGVVVQDAAGAANAFDVPLTGLTTQFAAYSGVFRTPAAMPSSIYLKLYLSAPLTNGRTVYIDKMSLGQMTQAYTSGPFFAVHAGSVPFVLGDYSSCAVTNSRGAAGTLDTFQTAVARMIPLMISNELLLPSSPTPTISDSLIA